MLCRRYRATRVHGIEARDVEAQRTHPQVCDNLGTCAVLPTAWNPGKVDRAPVPLERTLGVVGLLSSCRPLRFHWVSTTRALQSCLLAQLFCLATMTLVCRRPSVWARGAEFLASPRAPACPEIVAVGWAGTWRRRAARRGRHGPQLCPCGHRQWPRIRCRGLGVASRVCVKSLGKQLYRRVVTSLVALSHRHRCSAAA